MTPGFSYVDENGVWYADVDAIHVTYISSDPAFGMDLSLWGEMFTQYVNARLALKAYGRIPTNTVSKAELMAEEKRAMNVALGIDAMEGPPVAAPRNSWVDVARRRVEPRAVGWELVGLAAAASSSMNSFSNVAR